MRETNAAIQTGDNCNLQRPHTQQTQTKWWRKLRAGASVMKAQHRLRHDQDTLEPKHKHKTNATQVEGTERMPQSNATEQKPQGKAAEHSHRANNTMLTKLRAQ